jgi:hypothetical protein
LTLRRRVVGTEGRASPPTKKNQNQYRTTTSNQEVRRNTQGHGEKEEQTSAFQGRLLRGERWIIYLLHDEEKDKFYKTLRDPQGRLHTQEETPLRGNPIPTAQWGDQHTHIQFPRPKEYSLGEIGAPLDRTTVRQLTLEFSKNGRTPPTAPKE